MNAKTMYCNNCGGRGHIFKTCKDPITSCGILLLRGVFEPMALPIDPKEVSVLMVRRKDSMAYMEFIRGKYDSTDHTYIKRLLSNMTISEQKAIETEEFDTLWSKLWGQGRDTHSLEYEISKGNYETIPRTKLISEARSIYSEPEWGFPKGRRNLFETDYACAVREFCEETGYSAVDGKMIPVKNIAPLEENFIGSNYKSYKHKYFVMYMDYAASMMPDRKIQQYEVSAAEWYSAPDCAARIRSYNEEKLRILQDACAITDLLLA